MLSKPLVAAPLAQLVQPRPQKAPAAEAAAVQQQPEVAEPEPKRRLHSRFTEEHLTPLAPVRTHVEPRQEATRAPEPTSLTQPQPQPELTKSSTAPVTLDTQTSTAGLLSADSDMPLHGFRRHISLREPGVGIEQLSAILASRHLPHQRVGPSDDESMATAHAAAIAQLVRRASNPRLLTEPDGGLVDDTNNPAMMEPEAVPAQPTDPDAVASIRQTAADLDSGSEAAADTGAADEESYETDFPAEPELAPASNPVASDRHLPDDAEADPGVGRPEHEALDAPPAQQDGIDGEIAPLSGI